MKSLLSALCVLVAFGAPATAAERLDAVFGKPIKISPLKPPDGVQMVQILLENLETKLKDTNCESSAGSDRRSIHHAVALLIGSHIEEKRRKRTIAGKCAQDKFELPSGIEDVWNCTLTATTVASKGNEEIAVSTIQFSVRKKTWELIPKAFTCY